MNEPIFIEISDFHDNKYNINIKHIFQISEFQHKFDKGFITTVSYYTIPECKDCNVIILKTPERESTLLERINHLKNS